MKRACAALAGVALVAATACAPGGGDDDLTVLAAASLTDVFAAIDEQAGDLDAAFSFAGTPALLEQVRQGAPADVVAVADVTQLDALVASGDVGEPVVFARNRLVVVVSAGNPDPRVRSIDDLAEPGIAVVLAAPDVPAGRYARAALEDAGIRRGVEANVVSDEADVKAVAAKVALGEADAGIVYVTDARVDDRLRVVGEPLDAATTYAAAVVRGAPNQEAAERFVAMLRSDRAARVLEAGGFEPVRRRR